MSKFDEAIECPEWKCPNKKAFGYCLQFVPDEPSNETCACCGKKVTFLENDQGILFGFPEYCGNKKCKQFYAT